MKISREANPVHSSRGTLTLMGMGNFEGNFIETRIHSVKWKLPEWRKFFG